MRDDRVFLEEALHAGGELGQTIPVLRMPIIRSGAHFSSHPAAFCLAIAVILLVGHMCINVIYVVPGRDGKIVRWKWER